jgi:hypothetical protein
LFWVKGRVNKLGPRVVVLRRNNLTAYQDSAPTLADQQGGKCRVGINRKHTQADLASPDIRYFEISLTPAKGGAWHWRVFCEQAEITYGYAATRKLARLGVYNDLFLLLSLG